MKKCVLLVLFCTVPVLLAGFFHSVPVDPIASCVLVYNAESRGSGCIVGMNCVLTARHVADQPDLVVRTFDGDEHRVVWVQKDPDSDLALLYVEGRFDERPLLFDRRPLTVREEITVIGTPQEQTLQGCVLTGRVVKVDWVCPDYGYNIGAINLDVLDCHAAPGCSGGPVLDRHGHVRGVFIIGIGYNLGAAVPVEELDVK